MTNSETISHESYPDTHHDVYSKTVFGFWVFLLTDFVLFATLFASYSVLHNNTYGGPSARELFHPSYTLIQTLVLLTSSFTSGFAGVFAHRKNKKWILIFFLITFFLGAIFLSMLFSEFSRLLEGDNGWKRSAFLSAFFTIVGTHGIHVIFALLWILVFLPQVYRQGITNVTLRRITCLRMFWQFLNVIWVFIFTIVYLMGVR